MSRPHSSKLTLSRHDEGLELSHEEFAEADFQEPWRYERVEGRLFVMTPAGPDHRDTAEPFRDALVFYKINHPEIVHKVEQESWVIIDEDAERLPDLAVYLRTDEEPPRIPERVPELIFEIVSPTPADHRRDYEEKRAEYLRIGVQEYVIVDRFAQRVLVLRLREDNYLEMELGPNDAYTTQLLPGLEIPLGKIFEDRP